MPIAGDQPYFAKVIQEKGYGLSLKMSSFTEEELSRSIKDVLNNHKYINNIKTASQIFHNQPTMSLERATYWVEYVIKYGGEHVRSHALRMPWWQYLMVDVFVTIGVVIFILWKFSVKVAKFIFSILVGRKVKKE